MLDLARIRAVSLDLDDTLWPIWPAIHAAEQALAHWLGQRAPVASALFANAHARHDLRQQVLANHPDRAHDLAFIRLEAIRLALRQAHEPEALAEPAFEVFFEHRNRVTLFDDALPALTWLSQRYPLAALTNGNANLQAVGLESFFRVHITAVGQGVAKPDPRIFQATANALGLTPEQVLHVGDDAHLDVVGALQAGMQAVWVNRNEQAWTEPTLAPHEEITQLTELQDLLEPLSLHP